jgi:pilus assembly protein CpaB
MRSKSVLLLALALGCGLVASIGISQVMDREKGTQAAETEPVFVTLTDINPNDLITAQMIKLEEWPKGKVPAGAVTKLEDLEGKRCRQKLFAGEPVLMGKLRGKGDDMLPSDNIPKGFRVVNVRVDSVSGTGLIVPGDRVDVLVFLNKNPSTGIIDATTRTILQDIKVYAVDSTFVGKNESDGALVNGKTVSLLVTPSQAEKVMLASEMGSLRLIIRNLDDDLEGATDGARVSDILGGSEKNMAEQEQKQPEGEGKNLSNLVAEPKPVAAVPPPEPPAHSWKMVLVEGSVVRTVDFTEGDNIAAFEPRVESPPADSAPPSGPADPPAERTPPVAGGSAHDEIAPGK